LLSYRHHYKQT